MSNSVNVQPKTFPQKKTTKKKIAYSPIPNSHEYFQNPSHPPTIHSSTSKAKPTKKKKNNPQQLVNVYQTPVFLFSDSHNEFVMSCPGGWFVCVGQIACKIRPNIISPENPPPLQLQYVNCVKRWTKLFRGRWSGIELCVGRMFIPIKVRTDILHTTTTTNERRENARPPEKPTSFVVCSL